MKHKKTRYQENLEKQIGCSERMYKKESTLQLECKT